MKYNAMFIVIAVKVERNNLMKTRSNGCVECN